MMGENLRNGQLKEQVMTMRITHLFKCCKGEVNSYENSYYGDCAA